VYRPWYSQAEILKNIGLSFLRNGKKHRITSRNVKSAKSETHNQSPSSKICRRKKASSQRTAKETKEYQPSNEDKGDEKKLLLEGKAATKKKTICIFFNRHSLRNGFKVSDVKSGPTTVVLNMNELLLFIMYLTAVNAIYEMVLILNNYMKYNFMSGAIV
jgi:hypothetical protein